MARAFKAFKREAAMLYPQSIQESHIDCRHCFCLWFINRNPLFVNMLIYKCCKCGKWKLPHVENIVPLPECACRNNAHMHDEEPMFSIN
jgi:hypothetical protein